MSAYVLNSEQYHLEHDIAPEAEMKGHARIHTHTRTCFCVEGEMAHELSGLLSSFQNPCGGLLDLRMLSMIKGKESHRRSKIVGPHEETIDAIHGSDLFDILGRLLGFDLDDDCDVVIGVRQVFATILEEIRGGEHGASAAGSRGSFARMGVSTRADDSLGLFSRLTHRDQETMGAAIQSAFDQPRLARRDTHNGRGTCRRHRRNGEVHLVV